MKTKSTLNLQINQRFCTKLMKLVKSVETSGKYSYDVNQKF